MAKIKTWMAMAKRAGQLRILSNRYKAGQAAADAFNKAVAVGADVLYWPSTLNVPGIKSHTTSAAWVLASGHPVVKVAGHAAGISLTHIKVFK